MRYDVLVDKYRPKTFDNIYGQDNIVNLLKKVQKNPMKYPKNFLLYGDRGVGKTSIARVFANELMSKGNNVRVKEFDVTIMNKESMKDISDMIQGLFSFRKDYTVFIFDEFHLFSKEAQSVLLPILEDNLDNNIYYFLCTTEMNKILPTIISRCTVRLNFKNMNNKDSATFLKQIIEKENILIEEKTLKTIIDSSNGHIRDLLQNLDMYKLCEGDFESFINSTTNLIHDYLFGNSSDHDIFKSYPLDVLIRDLNLVFEYYVVNNTENISSMIKILETYMKFKYHIKTIHDYISVMILLKRYIKSMVV